MILDQDLKYPFNTPLISNICCCDPCVVKDAQINVSKHSCYGTPIPHANKRLLKSAS